MNKQSFYNKNSFFKKTDIQLIHISYLSLLTKMCTFVFPNKKLTIINKVLKKKPKILIFKFV